MDFVEDVGDGFHGVGHDAFAEVFLGGDEPDAELEELLFGDGGVDVVAKGPGAHVDDQVVDVALGDDAAQQLLEDRPSGDGLAGAAGLDVLIDVGELQSLFLGGGGLAL
ncbi:MAG TPA: hypothetical protein VFU43_04130 [Streptosporangiaceae bacterium]|nr:hypothetical protein [Streptosporangiaceae bacterium]